MYNIIIKVIGFFVMILIGIVSRKLGLVTREEGKTFGKIIMNFTLPCSLIYGFSSVQIDMLMILATFFGLGLSYIGMLLGKEIYKKRSDLETVNGMLCCSGYNISNFAIPFCQSFFPISATGYLGCSMWETASCAWAEPMRLPIWCCTEPKASTSDSCAETWCIVSRL